MQRWRGALAAKGRIPFETFPDDPIRAAFRDDVDAMQQFLNAGFPANAGNEVGYTSLMVAARGGKISVNSRPAICLIISVREISPHAPE